MAEDSATQPAGCSRVIALGWFFISWSVTALILLVVGLIHDWLR